jgi:hypothetical protein
MRVSNDQDTIAGLLTKVDPGDEAVWAIDLIGCETALLRAVLTADGRPELYVPGPPSEDVVLQARHPRHGRRG